ncbi:MAG: HAD hydrolase-like protein [Nanoarchaeota archaeon]|nr:HAD hydrolase-like protein [Nanoarchaeota archaeon]
MLRSRFRGLIFDVSGTLWDDLDQVFYANWGGVKELGFSKFPSTFGKYANKPLSLEGFKANAKGSCVEMFRSFGVRDDISDTELDTLYKKELAKSCREYPVKLYDGIEQLLGNIPKTLGSGRISIISAHPQDSLNEDLERLKIRDYFGVVEGGVHSKRNIIREHAKVIEYRDGVINISNPLIAYIGDTKSDMIAANEAGVYALGVSWGYQSPEILREGNPRIVRASPQTLNEFLFLQN